jgi:hypothetical protein
VRCNKNVDQLRARRIVVAIIILEYCNVPVLEFRIRIVAVWAVNLATAVVEGLLTEFGRDGPAVPPPEAEWKLLVVRVVVREASRIGPVIARSSLSLPETVAPLAGAAPTTGNEATVSTVAAALRKSRRPGCLWVIALSSPKSPWQNCIGFGTPPAE